MWGKLIGAFVSGTKPALGMLRTQLLLLKEVPFHDSFAPRGRLLPKRQMWCFHMFMLGAAGCKTSTIAGTQAIMAFLKIEAKKECYRVLKARPNKSTRRQAERGHTGAPTGLSRAVDSGRSSNAPITDFRRSPTIVTPLFPTRLGGFSPLDSS